MVSKNRGTYGFLGTSWVLITMAPRNSIKYVVGLASVGNNAEKHANHHVSFVYFFGGHHGWRSSETICAGWRTFAPHRGNIVQRGVYRYTW